MKINLAKIAALFSILVCLIGVRAQTSEDKISRFGALKAEVVIRRDNRSVPYIEARNDRDLYFAQGFTIASDRLWQMDLLRRTARGELAEIFGRTVLEEDRKNRALGFVKWAETAAAKCSPEYRTALEAYADGVNAYLRAMPAEDLPAEFRVLGYQPREWTPADSLAVSRLFALALGETFYDDAFRAGVADLSAEKLEKMFTSISPFDVISFGKDKPAAGKSEVAAAGGVAVSPPSARKFHELRRLSEASLLRVGLGSRQLAISNAWAVSGKRAASGKPLIANDPHLFPSAPSIWYLAHLSTPSHRVTGAATPGIPGIIIGRNDFLAWGITNLRADTQDLVALDFTDESRTAYRTPQGVLKLETSEEKIKVRKGFASPETEEVPVSIKRAKFGPVILEEDNRAYALMWSVLSEPSADSESFFFINRARNYREWRGAVALYKGQPQSFIYADTAGNIAYQAGGTVPLREKGDGTAPLSSAELKNGFAGAVKFADLPSVLNPGSGIVVSANNRLVGTDYPFLLSKMWIPPYRAKRISDLLATDEKMTPEKFRAIQADTYSNADALFIEEVKKAFRNGDENLKREISSIFDGSAPVSAPDSRQIALSSAMRKIFVEKILISLLGAERAKEAEWTAKQAFIDNLLIEKPKVFLPKEFSTYEELIVACYREAVERLTKELGEDRKLWVWGKMGNYKFFHPLGSVPFVGRQFAFDPIPQFAGGSGGTVNSGDEVSMRMIVDLSDSRSMLQSLATGQSGDPKSKFYKDQFDDWKNVRLGTLFTDSGAIAQNAPVSMRLRPQ